MNNESIPTKRATDEDILQSAENLESNPLVTNMLNTMNTVVAILNEYRQIISVNDSFMKQLGFEDPKNLLGLRPGEVLKCVYSDTSPHGCGTTDYCSTCGAALAIVSSLKNQKSRERLCAIKSKRGNYERDIAFKVFAKTIWIENEKCIMILIRDVTVSQRRMALERTFFHDINNMLFSLVGASELLKMEQANSPLVEMIHHSAIRLQREVEIQKTLMKETGEKCVSLNSVNLTTSSIFKELLSLYKTHPSAESKKIQFHRARPDISFVSDRSLLQRVLCNMVTNALEAVNSGEEVNVKAYKKDNNLCFQVHNYGHITEEIQKRLFQRNYSTKAQEGRGLGTYSMKLFGEEMLGGSITFESTPEKGTTFFFLLPLD